MKIPKAHIEWFVDRFHVGTPDEEIKADIRKRTNAAWSEKQIQAAERYAVKRHRQNQDLYHRVMTGRL